MDSNNSASKTISRKNYSLKFKQDAVEYALHKSKRAAADHFKVDEKQVQVCLPKTVL